MTNGLTDEAISAYAAELLDLEDEIEAGQDAKKAVYANLRDTYGKRAADALKLALKRTRMDSDKRNAADELDAEAERMVAIIARPRVARGARTREIIEEFDPETGEVIPGNGAGGTEEVASVATYGAASSDNDQAKTPNEVQPECDADSSGDLRREETASVEQRPTGGEVIADRSTRSALPIATTEPPPSAGANDDRGGGAPPPPTSTTVVTLQLRTHNPETHFLNSHGLERLHGCQNPEVCGSGQPRVKLCFRCSVQHDGPTHGEVA